MPTAEVTNSPSFQRSIDHGQHVIELHASQGAETGTFVTFIYEKDSARLLEHIIGTEENHDRRASPLRFWSRTLRRETLDLFSRFRLSVALRSVASAERTAQSFFGPALHAQI